MVDKEHKGDNLIFNEFDTENQKYWFGLTQKKFLHNVDTFYYSVKFKNDFRKNTDDKAVRKFRRFFDFKYTMLDFYNDYEDFVIPELNRNLVLRKVTFSRLYTYCMSYPEYFDIFMSPIAPSAGDGGPSVTCECIVQIRSYMLWQFGCKDCFETSYEYVKQIAAMFDLEIDFVQENRIDFCWHTNYLTNPEKFFENENFYKMRCDRFKGSQQVNNKVGQDGFEIDYVACGKRSDSIFLRIYQKTREVIEQNYKPWFLKIWEIHGLISKYDLYVYEKAYMKRSWVYRFTARIEFYAEYGSDEFYVQKCKDIINGNLTIEENELIKLANKLTPQLTYVINVEFQTMRKHSKTYQLIPFKNHNDKAEAKRIYDFLDNRKLITDYLTNKVFRLTVYDPAINKYDREMHPFWIRLRMAKILDERITSKSAKLVRDYSHRLSKEAIKKRFINSAITYGIYTKGDNSDHPLQDAFEAMIVMNDNDLQNARKYRTKKLRQLNPDELAEVKEINKIHRVQFVDASNGDLYDYSTLNNLVSQDRGSTNGL